MLVKKFHITGKTQETIIIKKGQNLNKIYDEIFHQHWQKEQAEKNKNEKKREANPTWNQSKIKNIKKN